MKIAMPIDSGMLAGHFGHAPKFAIVDIQDGAVASSQILSPPPHEPGSLPRWLQQLGVTDVICGGIGARAVELLRAAGIRVIAGVQVMDPAQAVEDFIKGNITGTAEATCQGHEHGSGHQCRH